MPVKKREPLDPEALYYKRIAIRVGHIGADMITLTLNESAKKIGMTSKEAITLGTELIFRAKLMELK